MHAALPPAQIRSSGRARPVNRRVRDPRGPEHRLELVAEASHPGFRPLKLGFQRPHPLAQSPLTLKGQQRANDFRRGWPVI